MKKTKKYFTEEDFNKLKTKVKLIREDGLRILSCANSILCSVSNIEWRLEFKDLDCKAFKNIEHEVDYCVEVLKEVSVYLINK